MQLKIRNQQLLLLPKKLIYLPAEKTLLVADTHFGKAATFRQAGIPVPAGTTQVMLRILSSVIAEQGAERLIVLGDFVHSATRAEIDFESELLQWREQHRNLVLTLVTGNHDRGHKKLFASLDMNVVAEPLLESPFAYCHLHEANSDENYFTFAGHIHPAIRLASGPADRTLVPCFAVSQRAAVLPAFGEFTGTAIVSRAEFPKIYAVADDQVIEILLSRQNVVGTGSGTN